MTFTIFNKYKISIEFKNLKCLFGYHDWLILERQNKETIKKDLSKKFNFNTDETIFNLYYDTDDFRKYLCNKICLRCRKESFKLKDYINECTTSLEIKNEKKNNFSN
jgi:hypothetical protein